MGLPSNAPGSSLAAASSSISPPSSPDSPPPQKEAQSPSMEGGEKEGESKPTAGTVMAGKSTAASMCGVCESGPAKYKCPRCYLPYCSVACNKSHHINHPPDPEPSQSPGRLSSSPAESAAPRGPASSTNPPNPFQVLETSEKLAWLFRKYPDLPQQLTEIHNATQPPPEDPSKTIPASLMHGVSRQGGWNRDKGIQRGKSALRKARRLPGEVGEAVREYCTLVLLLLNENESKCDSMAVLQEQFARQDTEIIRQLMEEENGRP